MEESWTDGATARWTEIRDLAVRAEEIGFETVWIPDELFGAQPMALSRFEEAVEIIVPLLRTGHADFEGTFHAARDLEQRPVGPRPGRIPIMIGAKGSKMLGLAARYADMWSWYVEERSDLDEFGPSSRHSRRPASILAVTQKRSASRQESSLNQHQSLARPTPLGSRSRGRPRRLPMASALSKS